jgi:membrane fusion protein, multidrug efflux system
MKMKKISKLMYTVLIPLSFLSIHCSEQEANAGGFSMPPMPVEVAQVNRQSMADLFEGIGTIEAVEEITVVSEIDAAVVSIPFEEGRQISKGQLIAKLDDSQLSAEVSRTEALYAQSKSVYNRVKNIVDQKAGSLQDLDDALAAMKVAEANVKLANARLNKTKIVAPFDGMIGSRKVSVGSFLRSGDAITELANINQIRISFSAPERFLAQLKRGTEVLVSSPVYPGHQVKGKIVAIEPVIDSETRSARIVAQVQNPGQKFHPGMSANVSVILNERPEALIVPNEAVFAAGDQSFVFVVNADSTVKQVPITTGLQLSDVLEVTGGLEDGMQVVKAGHQKIFEGAKVMPVNTQQQSSGQKMN